ncbi:hypothetical protein [Streptomyces sp. NPDC001843]|uniref:hypothetical protein n=1 Tax=Streptomyces sp. NPDC001843 TaxID=3364617 RepID=UPI0036B6CBD2
MKRRRVWRPCRLRHRWSRWALIKTDFGPGCVEIDHDTEFRMCRNCGHQEIREPLCESS